MGTSYSHKKIVENGTESGTKWKLGLDRGVIMQAEKMVFSYPARTTRTIWLYLGTNSRTWGGKALSVLYKPLSTSCRTPHGPCIRNSRA